MGNVAVPVSQGPKGIVKELKGAGNQAVKTNSPA
jgi:hypothetical protein